jgi:Arb2 domain-containing protein
MLTNLFMHSEAVENIVHERLEEAGLKKSLLPLDGDCKGPGRTPIFISKDLETKSRVVILVNDTEQDLGILAHRIAGGSGGINTGSMVSIVQALQKQSISAKDTSPPGIIITNAAQKLWDPEDKRAVTVRAHAKLRLPSLVHQGRQIDSRNWIPSNEDPFDHMDYILSKVLPQYGKANCRLDFIAIGIGADELEAYMDDTGWSKVGKQINTLTTLGSTMSTDRLNNKEYMKFRTQVSRKKTLQGDSS